MSQNVLWKKNKFNFTQIYNQIIRVRREAAQLDSTISIQNQVKTYLSQTGRKKKWLAAQLEVSPAVLSQWLVGKSTFSEKRLHDIREIMRNNA